MWVNRDLAPAIQKAAGNRPVVVLTGARQTGKTALFNRLFPSYRFVSLDLPSDAALAENDPTAFLAQYPPPVVIDEVQYAPGIFRHIKIVVERSRAKAGQFLITGSHRFGLMKEVTESLAGRAEIIELEPLSASEVAHAGVLAGTEEFILRGGYPELYQNPDLDSYAFYRSYIATYLERDVRTLLNVASLRDFERMLRACALRSGQLLNKAELARDVGISPSTANQWLSVLEASGQIALLEPWFSNKTKSIVKSPKLYLTDTGLLCTLLNIQTTDELRRSPLVGAIWETMVFAELRKREAARRHGWSIYYWSDRTREVDFVIDRGGRYALFEAKWTENPTLEQGASVNHLAGVLGENHVIQRSIVARPQHAYPLSKAMRVMTLVDL